MDGTSPCVMVAEAGLESSTQSLLHRRRPKVQELLDRRCRAKSSVALFDTSNLTAAVG
ncbi:unnamed protein product [Dibothriocephalus latus]|uniref:Uncharacterized protein n=1 Tax=Dibothriocephalus latus TaxID=60516 RepID=A0A3P7PMA2_DIBLA|nr:unnamed protein product [Dibothriocephalus latus]